MTETTFIRLSVIPHISCFMDKYDLLMPWCSLSLIFIYESNMFSQLMFEWEWINNVIKNDILKCFLSHSLMVFWIFKKSFIQREILSEIMSLFVKALSASNYFSLSTSSYFLILIFNQNHFSVSSSLEIDCFPSRAGTTLPNGTLEFSPFIVGCLLLNLYFSV